MESAIIARTRPSATDWAPWMAAEKGFVRPSQSVKEPAFSATTATGKTTSATSVTSL